MKYSWIAIKCPLPFRRLYLYWDKKPFIGTEEFYRRGIKVREIVGRFTSEKYPYVGIMISCWKKDATRVEEAMDIVDWKLRVIDNKYGDFIDEWTRRLVNEGNEPE